jgi:rare lipoprotein A
LRSGTPEGICRSEGSAGRGNTAALSFRALLLAASLVAAVIGNASADDPFPAVAVAAIEEAVHAAGAETSSPNSVQAVSNRPDPDVPADTLSDERPKVSAASPASLRDLALWLIEQAAADAEAVVGAASTYNPFVLKERDPDGPQTASGELYDPDAWTAAIQIELRGQFGGVRYGRNYLPIYALVESGGRRAILKINDVGPLRPGRIIDFNERAMRYFDPTMQRGVIDGVRVTPLAGGEWTPGPVESPSRMSIAAHVE